MSTNTTNYGLIKPGVNDPTDQDLWGGYLNSNFDTIDTQMKANADLAAPVSSTKTGNYALVAGDKNTMIFMDTTSGDLTLTLLDAATAGNGYRVSFKKIAAGNTLNITGTIDGTANPSFTEDNTSKAIVSDGTNWHYEAEFAPAVAGVETIIQRKIIQSSTTFNSSTLDTFEATGIQFALDNDLASASNKVRIRLQGFAGVVASGGNNIYFTVKTGATDLSGSFSALSGTTLDTPNGPSESGGVVPYSLFVERTPGAVAVETYELFSKITYAATSYYLGRSADGTETLPTTIIIEEIQV